MIMGGAFGERRGNRTPAAEANFFDGPEAAQATPNSEPKPGGGIVGALKSWELLLVEIRILYIPYIYIDLNVV